MTPGDAARVLGACALYDNRTVGTADAAAWFKVIGDLDAADAIEAVTRHYADSTDRIMPAHIRRIVKQIREERRRESARHEVRELPSRFEDDMGRQVRIKQGAASVREVLGPLVEHLAQQSQRELPSAVDELRAITAGPGWSVDEDATNSEDRL